MLDTKDEQCTEQLKHELEKKDKQCELKISTMKKRHAEEVATLERQVKRLKTTLEHRNISINALKEKVQFYRGVAYETRSESIENELLAQLTEEEVQKITLEAKASRQKAMYEAKLATSQAKKDALESNMLQSNKEHREEVDRLKVEHKSQLRDLIRRHAEDALSRKQQVKEFDYLQFQGWNKNGIMKNLLV